MKRDRNTRYAPEFLERKLSPSGIAGPLGNSALYSTPNPGASQDVPSPSSSIAESDLNPTLNTTFYADQAVVYENNNELAPDDLCGDPTPDNPYEDPFLDDPSDDPNDVLPDPEPIGPEPPDLEDGQPPFVPLPPAPIGPEGPR